MYNGANYECVCWIKRDVKRISIGKTMFYEVVVNLISLIVMLLLLLLSRNSLDIIKHSI